MKPLNWATAVVGTEKGGRYSLPRRPRHAALTSPHHISVFSLNLLLNFNNWMDLKVGTRLRATGPQTSPIPQLIHGRARASRLPRVLTAGQRGRRSTHRQGLESLWGLRWEHVLCNSGAGMHAAAGGCHITRQPPYARGPCIGIYEVAYLLKKLIHSKIV